MEYYRAMRKNKPQLHEQKFTNYWPKGAHFIQVLFYKVWRQGKLGYGDKSENRSKVIWKRAQRNIWGKVLILSLGSYYRDDFMNSSVCLHITCELCLNVMELKFYFLKSGWINKCWQIYITEYYLALKRNELMPPTKTWINLKSIIMNEVSQCQKSHTTWFHLYDVLFFFSFNSIFKWT